MTPRNETPESLLTRNNIQYRERNGELIIACPFSDCDADSRPGEAHCYINADTGLFDCKKCGERGNITKLSNHLSGDSNGPRAQQSTTKKPPQLSPAAIERYAAAMPDHIRTYLNQRGISNEAIESRKLGYGELYGYHWITIPVPDENGKWAFLKLRRDPEDAKNPAKYKNFPTGAKAAIYNQSALKDSDDIVLCEGEFDCLMLEANGVPSITSTAGAGTFKDEWFDKLERVENIYLCFDTDEAGVREASNLSRRLATKFPDKPIYRIYLPERMTDGNDITDYFTKYEGNVDELMSELPKQIAGPEPTDPTLFNPLTINELTDILGLTIKMDTENKAVTFLCQLAAYSDSSQFNISFNAPSSTGKSYIPTEIARLFPDTDVREIGYCSPTAFFHDAGEWDAKKQVMVVDLSRKILIFLDQPHTMLLEHLRPLLSHDQPEISLKITDKTQKYGLKTKTVILRGYPSVIFCTAGLKLDEQEATRFLLLSPEVNQEKIRQGIMAAIRREADNNKFKSWLDANPERKLLKDRIRAIKKAHIGEIKLDNYTEIEQRFLAARPLLKPRHQRDIRRLIALIKACALLNLWWRDYTGNTITANHADVDEGFKIWDKISVSQELNIPPYLYNLYQEVVVAAWQDKNQVPEPIVGLSVGVTRQDIQQKHIQVHGRPLDTIQLRQQILPMLEAVGLITQEDDPTDKRRRLVYPVMLNKPENNSEPNGGVDDETSS